MRNVLGGAVIAIALAAVVADVRPFGIEAWKWVLALIGVAIFVTTGRRET